MTEFTLRAVEIIRQIPPGRVCTYGGLAAMAGSPRAARQIVRILHSMSAKENLPWHRVINSRGEIALKHAGGFEEQKLLLAGEGIVSDETGRIDLKRYLWKGSG